ncbi:hypothetical protein QTP88_010091 [Uroleucon formosanum]
MRRSRQPNGGRIPENIHELPEALTRPENAAYSHTLQTPPLTFFQQEPVINGTNEGVIFANFDAIRRFREELATVTTTIGIDGTFKTVPAAPADLKSFLTFQVVFKNFERGLVNAVQRAFPESRLGYCWFYYTQTIVQYCHRKSNGVLDLVKRSFEAACDFRMVGPEFFIVFGEDYRTNNYLESFHSILLGPYGIAVSKKLDQVLIKNKGLNSLKQICKIITGGESMDLRSIAEDLTCNDLSFFKYAPITSVDVERSFSAYKCILADNRRAFQFENVRGGISRSQRVLATHLIAQNVQLLNEQDLLMFLRRTGHQNDAYVQREIGPYAQP